MFFAEDDGQQAGDPPVAVPVLNDLDDPAFEPVTPDDLGGILDAAANIEFTDDDPSDDDLPDYDWFFA